MTRASTYSPPKPVQPVRRQEQVTVINNNTYIDDTNNLTNALILNELFTAPARLNTFSSGGGGDFGGGGPTVKSTPADGYTMAEDRFIDQHGFSSGLS